MILIATSDKDGSADFVSCRMRERNIPHKKILLDKARKLGSFNVKPKSLEWFINDTHTLIESSEISSIWQRRIPRRKIDHHNPLISDYLTQEWRLVWQWFCGKFASNKVLDAEHSLHRASNKILQLELANKVGLDTPVTVITNDPATFHQFVELISNCVVKTLGGFGRIITEGESFGTIYTNRVNPKKLPSDESIRSAPVILQEEIQKDFEIRVTIIDKRVFACKIESQKSVRTQIDWRKYDFDNVPHIPFKLPQEIEDKILSIMQLLDIHFASVDLAVTTEGKYVFFEVNPNSQWIWIEQLTKLPITDALIDALVWRDSQ